MKHVFVDETKQAGYLLAAAVLVSGDLQPVRKAVRDLVLPRQRRIHMTDESDSRRRAIADIIVGLPIQATIYDAGRRGRTERDRRAMCLGGLIGDLAGQGETLLVLEEDQSLRSWDNQRLIELTRGMTPAHREQLRYEHQPAYGELLLCLPDAVAWCWAKGGDWRRRIEPAVTAVRSV